MNEENAVNSQISVIPSKEEKQELRKVYTKAGIMSLVMVIVFRVVAIVVSTIYQSILMNTGLSLNEVASKFTSMSVDVILVNIIVYAITYPIVLIILKGISKDKIKGFFNTSGVTAGSTVKYVLMAFVFLFGGSFVGNIVNLIGQMAGYQLTIVDTSTISGGLLGNLLSLFLLCVAAPIMEEIVFRGFILKGFFKVSPRFAIIVSALLFALMHGNFIQGIATFPLGVFLAYVAYKTGSIIPCIIIHMVCNLYGTLSGFFLSGMIEKYGEERGMLIASMLLMCVMLALLVISIITLIIDRKNYSLPKNTLIQKKRTFGILFTTWPIYVYVVLFFIISVTSVIPMEV